MKPYWFAIGLLAVGMVMPAFGETYFAQIENGVVKNVIVADQKFADSQPGTWIKYSPGQTYPGIGYGYNQTTDDFYPKDLPKPIQDVITDGVADFFGGIYDLLGSLFYTPPPPVTNSTETNSTVSP